jgi:hypothetical protein
MRDTSGPRRVLRPAGLAGGSLVRAHGLRLGPHDAISADDGGLYRLNRAAARLDSRDTTGWDRPVDNRVDDPPQRLTRKRDASQRTCRIVRCLIGQMRSAGEPENVHRPPPDARRLVGVVLIADSGAGIPATSAYGQASII